jgi:hypothetical protein
MLKSGKKIRALRDKQNKHSNSRVVRTKFLNETKTITPPCKLNGRSLILPTTSSLPAGTQRCFNVVFRLNFGHDVEQR